MPFDVFAGFFGIVAETIADVIGKEWPGETADAWAALGDDIATALADVPTPD